MRILAFDVGKNSAYAIHSGSKILESNHFNFKSYAQYSEEIENIIKRAKPEAICTSKPSRFYQTIYKHAQYIALIELAAELIGIPVFLLTDGEVKGWAFKGIRKVTKDMVMERFGGDTEDEADARMFACYLDANIETE